MKGINKFEIISVDEINLFLYKVDFQIQTETCKAVDILKNKCFSKTVKLGYYELYGPSIHVFVHYIRDIVITMKVYGEK